MHIKQVIISGFKSYKDTLKVDPFSPRHNLIVGRNGSGKTNFFDAIMFVIGDRSSNMRVEHRKKLLYDEGSNVLSAYVEIVFDNTDGRLPVDKKEVTLRRAIGVKKDEYFLNRRHVSKSDVTALLESAGFSRSNPYYCVRQGKVNKLCSMKDRERLDLLKEVAGTSVYEKRREESLKIMRETESRREKIDEVTEYIDKRLSDLQEEKDELSKYQLLDKQRRAIEYTLYDLDFRSAGERLDQIQEARTEESETANEIHAKLTNAESDMDLIDRKIKFSTKTLEETATDLKEIGKQHAEKIRERTAAELKVSGLEDQLKFVSESRNKLIHERDHVLAPQIKKTRAELEKIVPVIETATNDLRKISSEEGDVVQRMQCLFEKMGRSKTFKTAKERDMWIANEIRSVSSKMETAARQKSQHDTCLAKLEANMRAEEERRKFLEDSKKKLDDECRSIFDSIQANREKRNSKIEERRGHWKRMEQLNTEKKSWNERLQRSLIDQSKSCPRNLLDGIAAVRRISKEKKMPGVLGPLIENFTLATDKMLLPVESTVGNQLFNVIVEREATAALLMKVLVKEKTGRVTFMPLDVVREKKISVPETRDAFPLLSKLIFDPRISSVMSRIFGKTLVCRDKQTALKFSKQDWTCVTLDGEVFNSKGNMSGGYYNMSLSRMRAHRSLTVAKSKLKSIEEEYAKVESLVTKLDQEDAQLLGSVTILETDRQRALSKAQHLRSESDRQKELIESLRASLAQNRSTLESEEHTLTSLKSQKARLKAEIGTPLASSLSRSEDEELRKLRAEEKRLKPLVTKAEEALAKARSRETTLRSVLEDDLEKRLGEIDKQLRDSDAVAETRASVREIELTLENARQILQRLQREESDLVASIETRRKRSSELSLEITKLGERKENNESTLSSLRENLQEHAKRMEKLLNKRNLLDHKRDEAKRKISVLGSLPDKEVKEFRSRKRRELVSLLQEKNSTLKKYAHVNKKALAQFVGFSQQREELLNRKKQLDEGHEAIVELIDVLDQRKDEAIMRTFNDVAKHFEDVFKELVPQGCGRMVMLTTDSETESKRSPGSKVASSAEEDASSKREIIAPSVSRFTGIAVRVSFNAGDKAATMESLSSRSGGQKALVALAIIFAIQRCDPAPFYVFDEIDQALDATHRAAVAALIQRQANAADGAVQFITSTFWPEQVEVASRFYGVALQHKVSEIHSMEKAEASRFVRELRAKESVGGAHP